MGQVACGMVWRCPGGRARPLLPLALEAQQARYTNPHQGRGPQFLKSSDVQRAPVCLGRGLCPLDHSRSASGDPAMGPGGVSDAAALEAVGPTPLFVVAEASSNESGLVEPRRDLSPGCRGARRLKCGGAAETETPRDASQGCPCPSQSRWCVRFKVPFDDRDPQISPSLGWPGRERRIIRTDASVHGHEKVLGYGQLRSPLVAMKVPAFGHEKSPPLTEVST